MNTLVTTFVGPAPRIAIDRCGDGPLVVFLHGIGGNRSNWREQLLALGERYLAVAWDARGYGDSDDYEGPLRFSDLCDDLARVIAHLGHERAHLVGLSMGGLIAQVFWRLHPGRVASLTLADTRNGFQRHDPETFLQLRQAPLLAGRTPREIAPGIVNALAGPNADAAVRARLEDSIAALHVESYLKALRATTLVAASDEFRGRDAFVDLASIDVPTLVVCGTEDTVTPPAMSQALAEGVRGARLEWIEGAGHLSNVERPERFSAVLRSFLDALPSR